ncbi:MAG: amidotransferase [Bacteroidetes bacterium GWF2_42_66]|nr:MAG: amidotransferase [Bacteroidetes bacterium GWE2_42_39]OFY42797.1 MAG: amidotransferase [Bacteroidetes bacterium GWF2_42_66]HBL74419.1 amidotransferase [Prolixibacteraceae bacterium]HCR90958.1 amidotransferase [Prolixibacteraceae bacterium]HCU61901.1 amidotransferase [Prolixibacteraceae bacterium]
MRIHYFQHVPFEGLGCIEEWINRNDHQLSVTRFYEPAVFPDVDDVDVLIVMGGPMGIYDEEEFPWLRGEKQFIRQVVDAGKIMLGICLGSQLIADVLGARVYANRYKEIGWFDVQATAEGLQTSVFSGSNPQFPVFHWHGDTFDLPEGAIWLFHSEACRNQGFLWDNRVLALQFHFEVTSESIREMIENGIHEFTTAPYIQSPSEILRRKEIIRRNNEAMFQVLDRLIAF